MPTAAETKIRGVQVHGRPEAAVEAGHRVAVNLGGVDVAEIARGDALVDRGAFEPTRRLDVALELLPDARPLRQSARVRFHAAQRRSLGAWRWRGEGSPLHARIHLEAAAVVTRGDRFILRTYSPRDTIGGGVVLDPRPPRAGDAQRRGPRAVSPPGHLERGRGVDRVRRRGTGRPGCRGRALVSRAGLSVPGSRARRRTAGQLGRRDPGWRYARVDSRSRRARGTADCAPSSAPSGQPACRRDAARGGARASFRRAASRSSRPSSRISSVRGRLVARDRLALEGHHVSLSPEEARAQRELERVYLDANLTPPDLAAASADAGVVARCRRRAWSRSWSATASSSRSTRCCFTPASLDRLKADVREPQGRRDDCQSRRRLVQGTLRRQPEIRDSAAGVPGSGASNEADGREPDRALASDFRGAATGTEERRD